MALTLLQICQRALQESGEFAVPTSIVSNLDPTAVRLRASADRTGRALHRKIDWQALLSTHTFDTADGTGTYDLPADYQRFVNLTWWDRTNYAYIKGPVSAAEFEALRSGQIATTSQFQSYFRIAANSFALYPTPTSVRTIAYQYIGANWIDTDSDGVSDAEYFAGDANTCVFDDDLMVLGTRFRFLQASGAPFDVEKAEYDAFEQTAIANDGGKDVLQFGARDARIGPLGGGNVPESGFGI